MGHAQGGKKIFLAEIPKEDHQLSKSFYFIKIYVLTELWIITELLCFHGNVKPFYILDIKNFTLPSYEVLNERISKSAHLW